MIHSINAEEQTCASDAVMWFESHSRLSSPVLEALIFMLQECEREPFHPTVLGLGEEMNYRADLSPIQQKNRHILNTCIKGKL